MLQKQLPGWLEEVFACPEWIVPRQKTNKQNQQPGNEARKEELGGMRGWRVGKEKGGKANIHE